MRRNIPDISLLQEAKLAGAEISLASDAHFPEHVGYGFERIIAHAKAAGFDRAATLRAEKGLWLHIAGTSLQEEVPL